ncbi:hypothetical protein IQ06DRAFT_306274 [Phaeosphaeriaceae sp. SRC1lsM3a]|nr:hypothetical protein IQ06DRAFT_306274 [Stagonospora sp. SRC1lsM3a]
MRFINIIPFVALALPFANAIDGDSKTISLDSTCTTRNGWDEIWAEVMQMAESTRDLLQDSKRNNGADFEYLVAQVFKRFLTRLRKSNILRTDNILDEALGSGAKTYAPSSNGRLDVVQNRIWYDYVNQMYRDDHPCAADRAAISEGGTIGGANNDEESYLDPRMAGHNPDRIVITVCDNVWRQQRKKYTIGDHGEDLHIITPQKMLDPIKFVEDGDGEFNFNQALLDVFFPLPSRVIFHELVYAVTNNVIDDVAGRNSYGWSNVVAMLPEKSGNNADSYALLAQFVLAQDLRGLSLQRIELSENFRDDQEARDIIASWVSAGRMRSYRSIKKRPLIVVPPPTRA